MPNPHIAKPANPAPPVSTMSRCSTGTAFAFAAPWISTNCASTYLISRLCKYSFAAAVFMLPPDISRTAHHVLHRRPEVVAITWIAPDSIAVVRNHEHGDADHHRHDDLPVAAGHALEIDVAQLREHIVGCFATEHECAIFAQHGIDAFDR